MNQIANILDVAESGKLKVLFIAGWGRSGSTILGNILGQIEGFFHAGELYSLWEVGLLHEKDCGCGLKLSKCEVWSHVLKDVIQEYSTSEAERVINLSKSMPRTHEIPHLMRRPKHDRVGSDLEEYLSLLDRLYHAIHHVTQCNWIIDSSKIPVHAYLLSKIPAVDLYIVHLIRDPRAVAYSWKTKSINGHRVNTVIGSVKWNVRNVVIERFKNAAPHKYMQILYEEFAADPQSSIRRILRLMQTEDVILPFRSSCEVQLGMTHTVWGNPNRHHTGAVKIVPDERWRSEMTWSTEVCVNMLTWPLLLKYGYMGFPR